MTITELRYFLTVLLHLLNRNWILCTLFLQTTQDNSTMIHINSALLEPMGFTDTANRYTKQPLCPWTRHCLHKLEGRNKLVLTCWTHCNKRTNSSPLPEHWTSTHSTIKCYFSHKPYMCVCVCGLLFWKQVQCKWCTRGTFFLLILLVNK